MGIFRRNKRKRRKVNISQGWIEDHKKREKGRKAERKMRSRHERKARKDGLKKRSQFGGPLDDPR